MLFDAYASNFDASLQDLQYQVPRIIAETIGQLSVSADGIRDRDRHRDSRDGRVREVSKAIELMPPPPPSPPPAAVRILDLGAGTGLVCEELKKVYSSMYFTYMHIIVHKKIIVNYE